MPRQLLLDLGEPPPPTLDNFVVGKNIELLARLRELSAACTGRLDPIAFPDRLLYIWSHQPGAGRTHLLHALCHTAGCMAKLACPTSAQSAFEFEQTTRLYMIDDCHALSPGQQIAVFHLFNEVQAHRGYAFIATGNMPPLALAVRDDLRTRLGWGLVFQLESLDDAGEISALTQAAHARGFSLAPEVSNYLLRHFDRDMPSLMARLCALDHFSLEQCRVVTLPLLRKMLAPVDGPAADDPVRGCMQPGVYKTRHP